MYTVHRILCIQYVVNYVNCEHITLYTVYSMLCTLYTEYSVYRIYVRIQCTLNQIVECLQRAVYRTQQFTAYREVHSVVALYCTV